MITEPRWKSYIVETTVPIFTPEQCQDIIKAGRAEPRQNASVGSKQGIKGGIVDTKTRTCLLYTSPSPRYLSTSRMPSSACKK